MASYPAIICPHVIGRKEELYSLARVVERAREGRGTVVLLSGEAGIGKTRLAAEVKALAVAEDFAVLHGNCFQSDLAVPYAPLVDLLRADLDARPVEYVASSFGPHAAALLPLLPELALYHPELATLPPLEPEQDKSRLFAVVRRYLLGRAAERPLLMVIEDIHWCDDLSLQFFYQIARRVEGQPLLLLLTYRSDEVTPPLREWLGQLDRDRLAQEYNLTRLPGQDVDTMVRSIFNLPHAPQALLDTLLSLTDGNPFFVEEVLRSLVDSGNIHVEEGRWEVTYGERFKLRVPRSVQSAVKQRLSHLSEDARRVVTLAAVAGRRFDFALLQRLIEYDELRLLALIKELLAAQLVIEESADHFAFRHALTQQAIYADLLHRERRVLHGQVAAAIEQMYDGALDARLVELAGHWWEAGMWGKAAHYAQKAGVRAHALHAPRIAAEQMTRVVQASRESGVLPSLETLRVRGLAYKDLGDFDAARADYEEVLQQARATGNERAEWQVLLDLAALWAERDYKRVGNYCQRALELARQMEDSSALAHSLNRYANWKVNAGNPADAIADHHQALALFIELGDRRGMGESFDLLAMASLLNMDASAWVYFEQAQKLLREIGDKPALARSLSSLTWQGPQYRSQGEEAVQVAREIGLRSAEAYALIGMGYHTALRGEYGQALEEIQQGLAVAEEIEHRQWTIAGYGALSLLHLELVAATEARFFGEQAYELARAIGSTYWIQASTWLLVSASLLDGDLAAAEALLKREASTLDEGSLLWSHWSRADVALARGELEQAAWHAERVIAAMPGSEEVSQLILSLYFTYGKTLVARKQAQQAIELLQAVRNSIAGSGARSKLWQLHLEMGKLLHVQGRTREAEVEFSAGRAIVEAIAVTVPDEALRERFRQAALGSFPQSPLLSAREPARQEFNGLTAREREVAALVASGASNREIAGELVVGLKTVEAHVSHILSKLGFTSRAQIAVWAAQRGLMGGTEQS